MIWRFIPAHWWQSWGPLATTTFLSILFLSLGDTVQLSLVRGIRASILYPAGAVDATLKDLWEVRAENEELRRALADAEQDIARLVEASAENERLTALLGFRAQRSDTLIAARVVGRGQDVNRDWNYLTLRVSLPDSLASRSLVALTPDGLVGHVVERGLGFALVRSLASSRSAVHVLTRRSRVAGVVRSEGPGGRRLRLDHVPTQEDVAPGDTLVTSGLGTIFPKGIPVGTVTRVEPSDNELIRRVWVDPFVEFSRLEEVFLTPGQPTLDELPEGLTP